MPTLNSTTGDSRRKPVKPHDGFPLFRHATNRWTQKFRGKLHTWGPPPRSVRRLVPLRLGDK
jgi:hypothetical protein